MEYTDKQQFKVSYGWMDWEMKVEIDFNNSDVMKNIKDMVEFWSEWEDRLDCNDGDYVKTFLQQLGQKVFFMINECGSLYSLLNHFDWDFKWGNSGEEGYCKMDGSKGIKIIDVDSWGIDKDEFDVENITED